MKPLVIIVVSMAAAAAGLAIMLTIVRVTGGGGGGTCVQNGPNGCEVYATVYPGGKCVLSGPAAPPAWQWGQPNPEYQFDCSLAGGAP